MTASLAERRALVDFLAHCTDPGLVRDLARARLEVLRGYTFSQNAPASASSQKSDQLK